VKKVWISLGDAFSARIATQFCDAILVGDSLAMTTYGFSTTREMPSEVLLFHALAVKKSVSEDFPVIFDLPFLGRQNPQKIADELQKIGISKIKIEGADWEMISFFQERGFAVVGHLGLLPQTAENFSPRGRLEKEATEIFLTAQGLEKIGISELVLECIPEVLAEKITESLSVPTIGIGAGQKTSGQILVLADICGKTEKLPKFSRKFSDVGEAETLAIQKFADSVRSGEFPSKDETYS